MLKKYQIKYPLILLSAGKSQRMSELSLPKGLLPVPVHEVPLFIYQINNFFQMGGPEIIVVLGYYHERYLEEYSKHKRASENINKVHFAVNKNPEHGQYSSLLTAIQYLFTQNTKDSSDEENFYTFLTLVDHPLPGESVFKKLCQYATQNKYRAIIPRNTKGKGGHPILLRNDFLKQLLIDSTPNTIIDERLDIKIKNLPAHDVKHVSVFDESITTNLNTPTDWYKWLSTKQKS